MTNLNNCIVDSCNRCGDLIDAPPYCIEMLCKDCMLELMQITLTQLAEYLAKKYAPNPQSDQQSGKHENE